MEESKQLRDWWYSPVGRLPIARLTVHVLKYNPTLLSTTEYSKIKDKTSVLRDAREWRKRNPLAHNISLHIRRSLHGNKNSQRWESLVHYTLNDLKKHLEKQFSKGMSWENYGKWEIDHIIPVSAFNFTSSKDLDFKRCWSLGNLRPLWKKDNREKSAKILQPFQPTLKIK